MVEQDRLAVGEPAVYGGVDKIRRGGERGGSHKREKQQGGEEDENELHSVGQTSSGKDLLDLFAALRWLCAHIVDTAGWSWTLH
jgi:hypothetical protein